MSVKASLGSFFTKIIFYCKSYSFFVSKHSSSCIFIFSWFHFCCNHWEKKKKIVIMKWSIPHFQRFLLFVTKTKKKMFSNRTSIRLSRVCYVSPRINKWRSAQHHWNAWSNFLTTRHTPLSRWKRMYWEQLLHYWMIRNGLSERRQSCAQIFGIWWVELITKYIWAGRPMLLLVYVKEKYCLHKMRKYLIYINSSFIAKRTRGKFTWKFAMWKAKTII